MNNRRRWVHANISEFNYLWDVPCAIFVIHDKHVIGKYSSERDVVEIDFMNTRIGCGLNIYNGIFY